MGWLFTFIMYFTPVMLFLALLAVVLMLLGAQTPALWIGYSITRRWYCCRGLNTVGSKKI
jgi:hypothetical protein